MRSNSATNGSLRDRGAALPSNLVCSMEGRLPFAGLASHQVSYGGDWVTRSIRRRGEPVFDDLDAVLEFYAVDDLQQLVFALQSPPGFRGRGVTSLNTMSLAVLVDRCHSACNFGSDADLVQRGPRAAPISLASSKSIFALPYIWRFKFQLSDLAFGLAV